MRLVSSASFTISKSFREILGEVVFLGGGNIGDVDSSGVFSAYLDGGGSEKILLECGPTAFTELQRHGLVEKITHVALSSSSEYSLGSLSSLIIRRRLFGKETPIICAEEFKGEVSNYLSRSSEVDFLPIYKSPDFSENIFQNKSLGSIFLFNLKNANIIYSPKTPIFAITDNDRLNSMLIRPDECIIIQGLSMNEDLIDGEISTIDSIQDEIGEFKNFYAINHTKEEGDEMMSRERYLRSVPSILSSTKTGIYKLIK
jgi:hypothetical protein